MLQIKILLAQVGSLKNNNLDEQSLQEVIIDIVTSALRATCVNYNLSQYHGCPRLIRKPPAPAQYLPLHYDSMVSLYRYRLGVSKKVKIDRENFQLRKRKM